MTVRSVPVGVAMAVVLAALVFAGTPILGQARAAAMGDDGQATRTELVIATATAKHHFQVEIARTPAERRTGLMFRRRLAPDGGMLFTFDPPQLVSMWMKNTVLSLDMLFIDARGRIVNIARNTTPLSLDTIASAGPVAAVLEVAGGTTERLGIAAGDRVENELFSPRRSNPPAPDKP